MHRIMQQSRIPQRHADEDGGAAIRSVCRKVLQHRTGGVLEGRLQHQVFGWVAGDEQLGEDDEVGALGGRFGAC